MTWGEQCPLCASGVAHRHHTRRVKEPGQPRPPRCRSVLASDVRKLRRMGLLPDWVLTERQLRLVVLVEAGDHCAGVARLLEVSRASVVGMLRRVVIRGMRRVQA